MVAWGQKRSMYAPMQVRSVCTASCCGHSELEILIHSGSNVIVAGTAIFGAPEPDKVIALLKATVETAQAKSAAK